MKTNSIRAADSSVKLLKLIKNPVTDHLPIGCRKILTSFHAENFVKCKKIVSVEEKKPVVIVVGGCATGKVKFSLKLYPNFTHKSLL